jgi:hypothetical protein
MGAEHGCRGGAVRGERLNETLRRIDGIGRIRHARFFRQCHLVEPLEQREPAATSNDMQLRKVDVRVDEPGDEASTPPVGDFRSRRECPHPRELIAGDRASVFDQQPAILDRHKGVVAPAGVACHVEYRGAVDVGRGHLGRGSMLTRTTGFGVAPGSTGWRGGGRTGTMSRMPPLHAVATVAMVALLAGTVVRVWRVVKGQAAPKRPMENALLAALCALVVWHAGL